MTIVLGFETDEGAFLAADSAICENHGMFPVTRISDKIREFPEISLAFAAAGSVSGITRAQIILSSLPKEAGEDILSIIHSLMEDELITSEEAEQVNSSLIMVHKGCLYGADLPYLDFYRPIPGNIVVAGSGGPFAMGAWHGSDSALCLDARSRKHRVQEKLLHTLKATVDAGGPGCAGPFHVNFYPKP